jgi:hypothetical protein
VREASLWLSYTYLYVRMTQNPLAYGVGWEELAADPRLEGHRSVGGWGGWGGARVERQGEVGVPGRGGEGCKGPFKCRLTFQPTVQWPARCGHRQTLMKHFLCWISALDLYERVGASLDDLCSALTGYAGLYRACCAVLHHACCAVAQAQAYHRRCPRAGAIQDGTLR